MKLELNYGSAVVTLPRSAVDVLADAGELELRVLLSVAADPTLQKEFDPHKLSTALDASASEIEAAVAFWRGAGVFRKAKGGAAKVLSEKQTPSGTETPAASAAPSAVALPERETKIETVKVRVVHSDDEPHYTGKELLELTQRQPSLASLLTLCQNIAGKVFNTTESCKVISLADYHRLPDEYILLVFQYCKNIGKCSVSYVCKTALSLFEQGVDTTEALEFYLKELEKKHSLEWKIRSLLGIGKRALSKKEQNFITSWSEQNFSEELICYAFEQTVDCGKDPSLAYMNSILLSLKEKGITTPEAAKEASDAFRAARSAAAAKSGSGNAVSSSGGKPRFESFDADEFFSVALRQSDDLAEKGKDKP